MKIPQQIDTVSISRATNAAHYEYMDTIRRRIEEIVATEYNAKLRYEGYKELSEM